MQQIIRYSCPECSKPGQAITEDHFTQQASCPHCGRIFSVFIVDMSVKEIRLGSIALEQLKRVKKELSGKCCDVTLKMKIVKAKSFRELCSVLYRS